MKINVEVHEDIIRENRKRVRELLKKLSPEKKQRAKDIAEALDLDGPNHLIHLLVLGDKASDKQINKCVDKCLKARNIEEDLTKQQSTLDKKGVLAFIIDQLLLLWREYFPGELMDYNTVQCLVEPHGKVLHAMATIGLLDETVVKSLSYNKEGCKGFEDAGWMTHTVDPKNIPVGYARLADSKDDHENLTNYRKNNLERAEKGVKKANSRQETAGMLPSSDTTPSLPPGNGSQLTTPPVSAQDNSKSLSTEKPWRECYRPGSRKYEVCELLEKKGAMTVKELQEEMKPTITENKCQTWHIHHQMLEGLEEAGHITSNTNSQPYKYSLKTNTRRNKDNE